ncbi:hypothetical protein Tco_0251277 [Tanacetum coccineum]
MASCILLARYASTMSGMEETASKNWEELGTVVSVGTGVCFMHLGLSMLEMKPDDTEELCCWPSGMTGVMIT